MKLTVFESKYSPGWPDHEAGPPAYQIDVGRALHREYRTDAHCVAYVSSTPRRINTSGVGRTDIAMHYLFVDVDCSDVHGTDRPVPDAWRRDELEKVRALDAEHPGVFDYDSKGGHRLVYPLPEPAEIHDQTDVAAWTRFYRIALAYLERRFGIVGDPACGDFTRLFRMPHATRDKSKGPERRATFGDPDNIGIFTFEPTDADVARVDRAIPKHREPTGTPSMGAFGDGLFYWLFKLRGERLPAAPRGGWIVSHCPNESQHSVKSNAYTVVYRPNYGGELGNVHCLHGHCADLTAKDWLRFFTESEVREARERAGIVVRKGRAA